MRLFIALVTYLLIWVNAANAENCFDRMFKVEPVNFSDAIIEGREIKISLTYLENESLPLKPLSAVEVRFEIWSEVRPLPLYSSHIRELRTIDGGFLPGETLEASDFHFMDEREKRLAREASDLSVRFSIEWIKGIAGQRISCD